MANKFWVGGGTNNNWNSSPITNWANSSGGTGNQTAPGTSDVAVFDSNSGIGNSVINTAFTVQGLECDGNAIGTGTYGGTITHNTSTTLTINTGAASSFRLTSGMTYTAASGTANLTFTHTTGTAQLKSAGKKLGALTQNGTGGTLQLQDDLLVNAALNSTFTLTTGTFDANAHAITAIALSSGGSSTRALTLGGDITLGGNISANNTVLTLTATGMTLTKNSANIIILPPLSQIGQLNLSVTNTTLNDITLNSTTNTCVMLLVGTPSTYSNVFINSGWSLMCSNSQAYTITISNPFTWTGSRTRPMFIGGGPGTLTLSCSSGASSLAWGAIGNCVGSGGATFTANNVLDIGGNTGWTFNPPLDYTTSLTAAEVTTLGKMIDGVPCGTVTTGASTTSVPTSALMFGTTAATGVVADEFKGRVIQFSGSTTTAGLRGTASSISANTASNTPTFTVAALPATPASGDIFCVI